MGRRAHSPEPGSIRAEVVRAIEESGRRHIDIARHMGVSDANVSQIVHGTGSRGNLTVRTLLRLAAAIDCRVEIKFHKNPPSADFEALRPSWPASDPAEMFALAA